MDEQIQAVAELTEAVVALRGEMVTLRERCDWQTRELARLAGQIANMQPQSQTVMRRGR